MSQHLKIVSQLLRNGDPQTVLEVCDRGSALRLAVDVLRNDDDARREFSGSAERLAGYLMSLARPQERSARQRLPEALRWQAEQDAAAKVRQALNEAAVEAAMARLAKRMHAPAPQPAGPSVAPPPPPRPLAGQILGSVDDLAAVLQLRPPMLRLPQARQALADAGIRPSHENGREVWPLKAARRVARDTRARILRVVCSRVFVDSGLPVDTVG